MRRWRDMTALACLLLLSACGFQPVYSAQGSGVGPVAVAEIEGRTGYFLRTELQRLSALERGAAAPPVLTITLDTRFRDAAVQQSTYADRTLMAVTARWQLQQADGVLSGEVVADTGFDNRDQTFGAIALQADAEQRVAQLLAAAIWADIRAKRARP
jgi:LPS-assembly lipoprotein